MEAKNRDEIDLLALIAKLIQTIRKNFVLITLMTLVGAGTGFLWAYNYPKSYQSKMLMTSDILTFSLAAELINTLQELVRERNYETLAQKLNLPVDQATNISGITLTSALDGPGVDESRKNYLVITAGLRQPKGFDSLQNGLIQYFEDNEFVKVRVRQRKELLQQLQRDLESELKSLEELKQNVYSGTFIEKAKGNVMFDPTAVNSKIIDLKKDLLEYKNSLELVNSVEVVEEFTPFSRPVNGGNLKPTVAGAFIGIFLAFCTMAFRALDQAVRRSEQKVA